MSQQKGQTMSKGNDIGNTAMNTLLGKGSHLNGTLKVQGGLRIDGEFEGNLESNGTLVIGKDGYVKAEIKTKDAIIGGKVVGNITAVNKIELQSGASFTGDVKSRGIIIDNDVFFEGNSKMTTPTEHPK